MTAIEADLLADILEKIHGMEYMVMPAPLGGFTCIPHPPSRMARPRPPQLLEIE
jgi:hypothetical protein